MYTEHLTGDWFPLSMFKNSHVNLELIRDQKPQFGRFVNFYSAISTVQLILMV